uniref:Uncharacterized protein n=1 Tax=Timema monikensis TaxID=170555 RepID=A0A7R9HTA7_9NEOP|nr:unnamed protein product [Timema monikensis]
MASLVLTDSSQLTSDSQHLDGTIHQGSTPWRAWILKLFWGVINFIIMFFKSLFNPELHKKGSRYTTDYRSNGRGLFTSLVAQNIAQGSAWEVVYTLYPQQDDVMLVILKFLSW